MYRISAKYTHPITDKPTHNMCYTGLVLNSEIKHNAYIILFPTIPCIVAGWSLLQYKYLFYSIKVVVYIPRNGSSTYLRKWFKRRFGRCNYYIKFYIKTMYYEERVCLSLSRNANQPPHPPHPHSMYYCEHTSHWSSLAQKEHYIKLTLLLNCKHKHRRTFIEHVTYLGFHSSSPSSRPCRYRRMYAASSSWLYPSNDHHSNTGQGRMVRVLPVIGNIKYASQDSVTTVLNS